MKENRDPVKRAVWAKAYRAKHRIRLTEARRLHYKKIRLLCLQHYSAPIPFCACCGEKTFEFLALDHINGGGTQQRKELKKRGDRITVWIVQNDFPTGFQVLCHNCNMAKGFYGKCPHKRDIISITN